MVGIPVTNYIPKMTLGVKSNVLITFNTKVTPTEPLWTFLGCSNSRTDKDTIKHEFTKEY